MQLTLSKTVADFAREHPNADSEDLAAFLIDKVAIMTHERGMAREDSARLAAVAMKQLSDAQWITVDAVLSSMAEALYGDARR